MGYADLDRAMAQLSLTADDADRIVTLQECDDAMSAAFEHKAGFDVAQTPIWRGEDADVDPTAKTIWGDVATSPVLTLPIAARSISDVQVAGEYPETLTADDWLEWHVTVDGDALAVRRVDGIWWPSRAGQTYVTVTALWADGPKAEAPPAIVVNACTFLAVEEYRMRTMSPAGEIGPDGLSIRPRNPWNYAIVTTALDAVRPSCPAVVF